MKRLICILSIFCVGAIASERTPVEFNDVLDEIEISSARPWKAPDFTKQEGTVGYSAGAFSTPVGMESRVSFWIDIYSKYTTDQGVLHDSLYPEIVYEDVDFTPIMKDDSLTQRQKRKANVRQRNLL